MRASGWWAAASAGSRAVASSSGPCPGGRGNSCCRSIGLLLTRPRLRCSRPPVPARSSCSEFACEWGVRMQAEIRQLRAGETVPVAGTLDRTSNELRKLALVTDGVQHLVGQMLLRQKANDVSLADRVAAPRLPLPIDRCDRRLPGSPGGKHAAALVARREVCLPVREAVGAGAAVGICSRPGPRRAFRCRSRTASCSTPGLRAEPRATSAARIIRLRYPIAPQAPRKRRLVCALCQDCVNQILRPYITLLALRTASGPGSPEPRGP